MELDTSTLGGAILCGKDSPTSVLAAAAGLLNKRKTTDGTAFGLKIVPGDHEREDPRKMESGARALNLIRRNKTLGKDRNIII